MTDKFAVSSYDGVIKTFPTKEQCVTWCFEEGLVIDCHGDFPGDISGKHLASGITIAEIADHV